MPREPEQSPCAGSAVEVAWEDSSPAGAPAPAPALAPTPAAVFVFPLIIALGMGGHFGKNAIAPAEPALEAMGISPALYSIIASAPMAGGLITPVLWGTFYARYESYALVSAPIGVFIGQALLTGGLALQDAGQSAAASAAIAVGFVTFSLCKAGLGVLQHAEMARAIPVGLTMAFVLLIASTHLVTIACNSLVPQLIVTEGFVGMQIWLLAPTALSMLASCTLARMRFRDTACGELPLHSAPASLQQRLLANGPAEADKMAPTPTAIWSPERLDTRTKVVVLIGLWRAIVVGFLKSFQGVTSGILVERGLSATQAGELSAYNQWWALAFLPIAGVLADCFGRRRLVVAVSLSMVVAGYLLYVSSGQTVDDRSLHLGLLMLAIAGVIAPVLPLAMVPANTSAKGVGPAYGVVETLFCVAEIGFHLMIGALRAMGGFYNVLVLACVVPVVASALSLVLFVAARDDKADHGIHTGGSVLDAKS